MHQGNYKPLGGLSNNVFNERLNHYNQINQETEMFIDQRNEFLGASESGIKPISLRPKIKGSRLRKKSNLNIREAKTLKEKETPLSTHITKGKGYKLGSSNLMVTPINSSDKHAQNLDSTPISSLSVGKHSSNSFVFMKNNVAAMRKVQSYPVNDDNSNTQDDSKTTGTVLTDLFSYE